MIAIRQLRAVIGSNDGVRRDLKVKRMKLDPPNF